MRIVPISAAKDRLSELVDSTSQTHEQVTITRNGSPAAVLIGADEWESLQETLFWLSEPGIRESLADGRAARARGDVIDEETLRSELGLPRRTP